MKVLLISSGLSHEYGGSAISESSLAANLASRCEVQVLCRADRHDPAFSAQQGLTNVIEFQPFDWVAPSLGLREPLGDHCRSADVVHLNGHWRWENYFIAQTCQRLRVPLVLHPRGMLLVGHRRPRLKKLFNRLIGNFIVQGATKVVALSKFETKHFVPYSVAPDRIAVIPNGIPTPPSVEAMARPIPYILYLGRIEARKNLHFLIDAYSEYAKLGGQSQLIFVGPSERGYSDELRQRIEKLGMQSKILIEPAAYGDGKWKWMRGARAVVYPTVEEPFGRVPFEAVACGSFPVVPIESGGAEYLQRFLPSCVYPQNDFTALARVLRSLEEGPRMAELEAARKWVADSLNWEKISSEVFALYEEITSKSTIASTIYRNLRTGGF